MLCVQLRKSKFKDYGEYLDSLEMTAEIEPFKPVYYDRITQLINKTNQFNLTTKRYTLAEVETIARDPELRNSLRQIDGHVRRQRAYLGDHWPSQQPGSKHRPMDHELPGS